MHDNDTQQNFKIFLLISVFAILSTPHFSLVEKITRDSPIKPPYCCFANLDHKSLAAPPGATTLALAGEVLPPNTFLPLEISGLSKPAHHHNERHLRLFIILIVKFLKPLEASSSKARNESACRLIEDKRSDGFAETAW